MAEVKWLVATLVGVCTKTRLRGARSHTLLPFLPCDAEQIGMFKILNRYVDIDIRICVSLK